ncbi:MAG: radical SAM protein [Clostridiales bacterium]|nr:radical SAM protein [Clostridiales bacterium]
MGHCRKRMLSFFITTGCNLACDYCYVDNDTIDEQGRVIRKNQTIDLEFAYDAIDYFLNNGVPSHLRFFGPGEPTVRIDVIKAIIDYAKSKSGLNVTTELQTNGAFSKDVVEYLAEEMDIIWISSDGLPIHHDAHRKDKTGKGSSRLIEKILHI